MCEKGKKESKLLYCIALSAGALTSSSDMNKGNVDSVIRIDAGVSANEVGRECEVGANAEQELELH